MSYERNYKVVVTGFGPFGEFVINDSWETVKGLWNLDWPSNIKLITRELPVIYETVYNVVPQLWHDEEPDLVVHCGVSGASKQICIEKFAFNSTYDKKDVVDRLPSGHCCRPDGAKCLKTKLDVNQLCESTNSYCVSNRLSPICTISNDPGRYLCCFTYYVSLFKNESKSLFVHVPPSSVFNVSEMSRALQQIIYNALKQLEISCDEFYKK